MPPKKAARSEVPTSPDQLADRTAANALTADYIKGASEANLLNRLIATSSALEGLPAGTGFALDKALFEELSRRVLLNHPSADVQIMTATNLAEAVRVASVGSNATAAAAALPLKAAVIADVANLWVNTILRLRNNKSSTVADYIRHLIETLAVSHAMAAVVAQASLPDAQITSMFETLLSHVPENADDTFIGAIATIIADCVAAYRTVTDAQMRLFMLVIAQRSVSVNAYRVVVAVLRRHDDILQNAVSDFVITAFTDSVEALHRMDVEGEADSTERRNAAKRVSAVASLVSECAKASVPLVQLLLPAFVKLLDSLEGTEARAAIVSGAGQAFLAVPNLVKDHLPTYMTLVRAMQDGKPAVRLQSLQFASEMLLTHATSEGHWAQLAEPINHRVLDHDEHVRRAAFNSVCALAEMNLARIPPVMLQNAGSRCADRRPALRAYAIERLAATYRSLRHAPHGEKLSWVPKAILESVHVDGNAPFVEASLSEMLPNPSRTESAVAVKKEKELKGSAKVPTIAIFDFETLNPAASTGASTASSAVVTFAQAFVLMCEDLLAAGHESADGCFATLRTFFEKRTQLRAAVKALMQIRGEAKTAGISKHDLEIKKEQLGRLVTFLGARTHAKGEEWTSLLTMKDEKAVKALIALAADDCEDLGAAAAKACQVVKACVAKDVANFFEKQVVPRLAFPVSSSHVDEIVKAIRRARGSGGAALLPPSYALSLLAQSAPHLVAKRFSDIMDFVVVDSKSEMLQTQDEALTLLLRVLISSYTLQQRPDGAPKLTTEREREAIHALGHLCLSSRVPSLAKWSAKAMTTLYSKSTNAFVALTKSLSNRIAEACSGDAVSYRVELAGIIKAVQIFATECSNAAFRPDVEVELFKNIGSILVAATHQAGTGDGAVARNGRGVKLSNPKSHFHVIVDCCAKAISAFVARYRDDSSRRGPLLQEAKNLFFAAFSATKTITSTLGGTLKRLALVKQMIKLLKYSDLALVDAIRIAMFASAEHITFNRVEIQKRISGIIQTERTDMRLFGALCLTALGETSRAGYNHLKHQVQLAADKLRSLQGGQVLLASKEALVLCPEYSIPFIVIALAHHGFYQKESRESFVAFQRVWHILFDELTRLGVHKVSFLQDLLRKIRSFDDTLQPESDRTRIICDLGLKVLTASLTHKSVGVDALKPYPSAVLVPSYFAEPKDKNLHPLDRVYLPDSVAISSQPVFRAATRAREDDDGDAGDGDEDAEVNGSDDEPIVENAVDDSRMDEVFTPSKLTAPTQPPKAATGRRDVGRGKSQRESTPPPERDAENEPPTSPSANSKKRSTSNARAASKNDATDRETHLQRFVRGFVKGKSAEEIAATKWAVLKNAIVEQLNMDVTAEVKNKVLDIMAEEVGKRQGR